MNLATHAGLLWAPPADAADTSWQLIPRSLGLSKSEEAPPSICAHSLWSSEDFPEYLLCVKICKHDGQTEDLRIEFHRRDGYLIGFVSCQQDSGVKSSCTDAVLCVPFHTRPSKQCKSRIYVLIFVCCAWEETGGKGEQKGGNFLEKEN